MTDAAYIREDAIEPEFRDYVALLKPRVMSLVIFTAVVGLAAAPAPAPSAPTGAAKTAGAVPTEPSQRPPSPPVPTEAEADAAQVQDTTDGAAEAAQESEGAAAEPAPKEAEVAPSPAPKRRRSTRRTKSKAAPPPPPPPPPPKDPPKDPADLLRQARMAQMQGDAAKAYRLAAEANRIKPSKAALRVMGAAACKMGDASKARSVYRKLSGAAKADMAKLCASRGITL